MLKDTRKNICINEMKYPQLQILLIVKQIFNWILIDSHYLLMKQIKQRLSLSLKVLEKDSILSFEMVILWQMLYGLFVVIRIYSFVNWFVFDSNAKSITRIRWTLNNLTSLSRRC